MARCVSNNLESKASSSTENIEMKTFWQEKKQQKNLFFHLLKNTLDFASLWVNLCQEIIKGYWNGNQLYLTVNSDGSLSSGALCHDYDIVLSLSTDYQGTPTSSQ